MGGEKIRGKKVSAKSPYKDNNENEVEKHCAKTLWQKACSLRKLASQRCLTQLSKFSYGAEDKQNL